MVLGEIELACVDQHVLDVFLFGGDAIAPRRATAEVETALSWVQFFIRAFEDQFVERIEVVGGVVEDLVEQNGKPLAMRGRNEGAKVVWSSEIAL
jgi:hypothetical protein